MSTKGTTQPQTNTATPTTSTLLSPYFGRENQCDSIIEFLLDESHDNSSSRTNKVPVIAIIGLGGSGKSHTAQHIYNDHRVKNHFDINMWVHVTRDFNVVELTRQMLESTIGNGHNQITSLDVLQKKLKESLSNQKKLLLVLDDVWCDDKMKWDLLVGPLNEAAEHGSEIIITTRMENIAYNLHAKRFHLEELKVKECWSVLKHYAFGNYEEIIDDQELINVGNQIISKAKHSPLALRVVGCSLINKRSVSEWEKVLQQDMLKETMDLLLFSYQCLPSHLQRCFAYCSLFPKGCIFCIDVHSREPYMISLWIAQGFIEYTNGLTLEEVGNKYMEQLTSYSFFEKKHFGFVIMHDLLHDLAEKVSEKQCRRIEHHDSLNFFPSTCIHLSLCIKENLVSAAPSTISAISDIFNLTNLHSLIILCDLGSTDIFKSKKDIFQNLTKLRALYVKSNQQLEVLKGPYIHKLKHLRYLHGRYDSKLPVSLAKLYKLQFFILVTDQIESDRYLTANTLPKGFCNLIDLRTLQFCSKRDEELSYLYYNSNVINIGKLTSLQNLKEFYVDAFNGMISLRNLLLGGSLSIQNLENVKCKREANEAMLHLKNNLKKLTFEWSSTQSSIDTCEEVLEGLEPHQNLEKLEIKCYQGVKVPKWMIKENWLPRLQTLSLQSCTSFKIVPFLPPRLQQLYVCDCDELMQLPLLNTIHILSLSNCPKLQALTDLSPTVINLNIIDCPKLASLGNLQRHTSLYWLIILKCPMLRREAASFVEGVVEGDIANRLPQLLYVQTDEFRSTLEPVGRQAFSSISSLSFTDCAALPNLEMHSSLQRLSIEDCPDVESLPNLPVSLQFLWIDGCPKLKEKYEEGGPLRNTISHIPHIFIDIY